MSCWLLTGVAGESGCLGPQNGLSYLPKILFSEVTLVSIHMGHNSPLDTIISSPDLFVAVSDHLAKPLVTIDELI